MLEVSGEYNVKVRTYHKNGMVNYEVMFKTLKEADDFYMSYIKHNPACPVPTIWTKVNSSENIWSRTEGY